MDAEENIRRFQPQLDTMLGDGLVTLADVQIYRHRAADKPTRG